MDKDAVFELVEGLDEEEHRWIDFKEDYYIGGIAKSKAEFIRDVASLTNTLTDQDKHYILIGFDDDGNLVGVTESETTYTGNGPRHFFTYDESDIQEIVDSNLSPTPDFSVYKYERDGKRFAVLEIRPDDRIPCITTQDINDDYDNRVLHRGLILIRTGSGKKIAEHEDLEKIIDYRIQRRREDILENVRQIVELDPDEVETLGGAVKESGGVPVTPDEDAELTFAERQSREPASSLEQELNEDITQWRDRGDDFIEKKPLWKYYSSPDELPLSNNVSEEIREETILFLIQSSLKNRVPGLFWVSFTDTEKLIDFLIETPDRFERVKVAAKVFAVSGNEDWYRELDKLVSYGFDLGDFAKYRDLLDKPVDERVDALIENTQYSLNYDGFEIDIDLDDVDAEEIQVRIPEIAEQLIPMQEAVDEKGYAAVGPRDEFQQVLIDLEWKLGEFLFDEDD